MADTVSDRESRELKINDFTIDLDEVLAVDINDNVFTVDDLIKHLRRYYEITGANNQSQDKPWTMTFNNDNDPGVVFVPIPPTEGWLLK